MKYTVRSADGELTFRTFGELEHAYFAGLVDPEDEVQEEGTTRWRKASSFAALRRAPPLSSHEKQARAFWLFLGVALGSVGLWGLETRRYGVLLTAAVLLTAVLWRMSTRASRIKQPR
jgi:hypothetical protein